MSKTALIIGTSVIASSIADNLLESDYEVITASDDDSSKLVVDFSSEKSVSELISRLSNHKYDVIVNCTAKLATDANGNLCNESSDFDYSEFTRVFQHNVTVVAAICLGLKDNVNSGGVIINISSTAANEGAFATLSYNASKAAVNNLTKSLANIFGPKGIRVNAIAPGWIPPSADVADHSVVALANSLTPSKTIGKPADIVTAVNYLIENSFQNGSILTVDGGLTSSYLPYMLENLQMHAEIDDKDIQSLVSTIDKLKTKTSQSKS